MRKLLLEDNTTAKQQQNLKSLLLWLHKHQLGQFMRRRNEVRYLFSINIKQNSKAYCGATVGVFATKPSCP